MPDVRLTPIILFVRDFARAAGFYRALLGEPLRLDDHWAEFDAGGTRFAVHAGYEGAPARQGQPVAIHFVVANIHSAMQLVRTHGGAVEGEPRAFDSRSEDKRGWEVAFTDPEGNEFELQQLIPSRAEARV